MPRGRCRASVSLKSRLQHYPEFPAIGSVRPTVTNPDKPGLVGAAAMKADIAAKYRP